MNSSIYIRNLIAQGEHQELDFKYELNDSRKIARSLVAFANTDGGRLLVGVKDNGKISGIDSEEEMYVVESAAQVFSIPEIPIKGKLHHVEGKEVLEIIVEPSEQKHKVKEKEGPPLAYIRQKDMNLKANRVLLKIWELETQKSDEKFSYGEKEEKLFRHLREKETISFKSYCKITRQHYKKATNKLAKLVLWEVLDMEISEKGVRYMIGPELEPSREKFFPARQKT